MPPNKKSRVQAYLEPELAEIIRNRAAEEGRPESREVSRLVRLGLEAELQLYRLGGVAFRTKADIQQYLAELRAQTRPGQVVSDAVLVDLAALHPLWDVQAAADGLNTIVRSSSATPFVLWLNGKAVAPDFDALLNLVTRS